MTELSNQLRATLKYPERPELDGKEFWLPDGPQWCSFNGQQVVFVEGRARGVPPSSVYYTEAEMAGFDEWAREVEAGETTPGPKVSHLSATPEPVEPESAPDDPVNHPSHYTSHPSGVECINITRHHNFAVGNAIKYLWRAGLKGEGTKVEDLRKAIFYIEDEIKRVS